MSAPIELAFVPVDADGNTILTQAGFLDCNMIFDVKKIIASLSRGMTLEPDDVIATGTPKRRRGRNRDR